MAAVSEWVWTLVCSTPSSSMVVPAKTTLVVVFGDEFIAIASDRRKNQAEGSMKSVQEGSA